MRWGHGERIFVEGNPGGDPIISISACVANVKGRVLRVFEIDLSESGIHPHGFRTDF